MNYFDKENIGEIRLRSFFEEIREATTLRSEGAWSFELVNAGDSVVILTDVGNKVWELEPGFPYEFNTFKFPGHPGIVRDDIIKVEFGEGSNPLLKFKYDRFVKKGDDVKYPGQ